MRSSSTDCDTSRDCTVARNRTREVRSGLSLEPEKVAMSLTLTLLVFSISSLAVLSFKTRSMTTVLKLPSICSALDLLPTRASMSGRVWV